MTDPESQQQALRRTRSYWWAALLVVAPLPFIVLPIVGDAWLTVTPEEAYPGAKRFTLLVFMAGGALAMLGLFARNQAYKRGWQADAVSPSAYALGNGLYFASLALGAVVIALAGVRVGYPAPSFAAAPVYAGLLLLSRPNGRPMSPHPPTISASPGDSR